MTPIESTREFRCERCRYKKSCGAAKAAFSRKEPDRSKILELIAINCDEFRPISKKKKD